MVSVGELINRIRVRYEAESGGSETRYSDEDITLIVNEGMECLAESTGYYERYCTLPIIEGQSYYDLRGFTPETVGRIKSVWSTTFNDWLQPTAAKDLPYNWETNVGTSFAFFTRGIHWLGVYPTSDVSEGYLRVYFSGIPYRLHHTQMVLQDLPNDHVPALEDYAIYEMAAMDRNSKLAIRYWQSYDQREKNLRDIIDRRLVSSTTGRFGGFVPNV